MLNIVQIRRHAMLITAVLLFGSGAIGGVTRSYLHISKKQVPFALVIGHGLLVATGLVLLIIGATQAGGEGELTMALIIFVLAAIGGFTLLTFHLRFRPLPAPLIYVHGAATAVAFMILFLNVIRMSW